MTAVASIAGALLLAQAWIAWRARAIADGETRRTLVQAYAGFFALGHVARHAAHAVGRQTGCVQLQPAAAAIGHLHPQQACLRQLLDHLERTRRFRRQAAQGLLGTLQLGGQA